MTTSPVERQRLLAELSTLAISELVRLWRRASTVDVDFAAFLIDAFPEIATTYATVAADLAADWYTGASPSSLYEAITGTPPKVAALRKSANWAMGANGDMALNRMSGTLQRAVFDGARNTTLTNVRNEPGARWARYASANACDFCRMLASRGAVYRSFENAAGRKYHDHCHCIAVEKRPT